MIIDNVKVYTEEKTFVKGGIMLDGDKIQRVYAEEEKPQFGEKEGDLSQTAKGKTDQDGKLYTVAILAAKEMTFVMEMKRRLRGSHSMRPPLV